MERGEVCLLYGPPGVQKSFTLEHLVAERHRAGQDDALYVYASVRMTPFGLMRRLSRQAGIHLGGFKEQVIANFLGWCSSREKPPAIVVDEAQHLTVDALDTVFEIDDDLRFYTVRGDSASVTAEIRGTGSLPDNQRWYLERIEPTSSPAAPLPSAAPTLGRLKLAYLVP